MLPLQRRPSLHTLYLWEIEQVVIISLEVLSGLGLVRANFHFHTVASGSILLQLPYELDTCNRPSLVYKAPVVSAFFVFFQIVSHYFGSSSVTWRTP